MDSDNKLRELFELDKTDVPDFLDWAEMESGIKEKMAIIDSANESVVRNKWLRRFFFLSLGFLFLIPLTCGPDNTNVSNRKEFKEQSISLETVPNNGNTEDKATVIASQDSNSLPPAGSLDAFDNDINPNQFVLKGAFDNEKEPIEEPQLVKKRVKDLGKRIALSVVPLMPYENKLLDIIDSEVPAKKYVSSVETTNSKYRSNMISVFASPGTWRTGWGADTPINTSVETELWSFGFGFNYTRKMEKGLLLNIGLHYQMMDRKLEWNDLIEDYSLTLTDTIIGFEHNNITSELSTIVGDTTFVITAERQVTHYNRSEVLQIPLGVGYSHSFGRLSTNMIAGTAIGIWKKHEGISLQDGFLEDYSNRPIFNTDLSFSGFIDLGVSYHLSEQLSVGTSFMVQKEYSNWSYLENASIRPTVFNAKFIVSYSL